MRTMAVVLAILLTLSWFGVARAQKVYDPYNVTPPQNKMDDLVDQLFGPEVRKNNPQIDICQKSKTDMEIFDNCTQPMIRTAYQNYPSDLVQLLIAKLRLVVKKRSTGKISKEEADVARADAFVQFENEAARRASLVHQDDRQDQRDRADRAFQQQILERDAKQREIEIEQRSLELRQEQLQREQESRQRQQEDSERLLRDISRPATRTDCYTDPYAGTVSCTTR